MDNWISYLEGRDLRSIAGVENLLPLIQDQTDFDKLFKYLFVKDRLVIMRAADAVEKITIKKPAFLAKHKKEILDLLFTTEDKELKWHLAQLVARLELSSKELAVIWEQLSVWAVDKKESKIVRVNSIQSLYDLSKGRKKLEKEFKALSEEVALENIPSISARLKKLLPR